MTSCCSSGFASGGGDTPPAPGSISRLTTEIWVGEAVSPPADPPDGSIANPYATIQAAADVINASALDSFWLIRLQSGLAFGNVELDGGRNVTIQSAGYAFMGSITQHTNPDHISSLTTINVGSPNNDSMVIDGDGGIFVTLLGQELSLFGRTPGWVVNNTSTNDQQVFDFESMGFGACDLGDKSTLQRCDDCSFQISLHAATFIEGTGCHLAEGATMTVDGPVLGPTTNGMKEWTFEDDVTLTGAGLLIADAMTWTQIALQGVDTSGCSFRVFLEAAIGVEVDDSTLPFGAENVQEAIQQLSTGLISPLAIISKTVSDSGGDVILAGGAIFVPESNGGPTMVAIFPQWNPGDVLEVEWNCSLKTFDGNGVDCYFWPEYSIDGGTTWTKLGGAAGSIPVVPGPLYPYSVNASGMQDITASPSAPFANKVQVRIAGTVPSNNALLDFGAGNTFTFRARRWSQLNYTSSGGTW
jgi:hypothetical protein